MKISRKDIVDIDNILGHIVLQTAMSTLEKLHKELLEDPNEEVEIKLICNGKYELNLEGFIEHWQSQVSRMINDAALRMIEDKLEDKSREATELLEHLIKQTKRDFIEKLGIEVGEDYWY